MKIKWQLQISQQKKKKKGPYGCLVCGSSNVWLPIWATEMPFLPEGLYYMSANSKGSGKTALAWAFVGCNCDKYPFLMGWLQCM